jgi:hypothetical protein
MTETTEDFTVAAFFKCTKPWKGWVSSGYAVSYPICYMKKFDKDGLEKCYELFNNNPNFDLKKGVCQFIKHEKLSS